MLETITEQHIIEGWEKWGNGTPLKPGFAKWLADKLNDPMPIIPMKLAEDDLFTYSDSLLFFYALHCRSVL